MASAATGALSRGLHQLVSSSTELAQRGAIERVGAPTEVNGR
jgi:hypothetical protein